MVELDDRDDTAAVLVGDESETPTSNGKIVNELDEKGQPTGFKLFVPNPEEHLRMEQFIAEELSIGERSFERVWSRAQRNLDDYEALPSGDKEDLLNLPVGKTAVNYLVAFLVNRIYNKEPIATATAEEFGMYEVPMPRGQNPLTGETISDVQMMSAEELSEGLERLLTSYLKGDKLKFRKFLYDQAMDSVRGAPPWGKTCYERVLRPQLVPKWERLSDGTVVMTGIQEQERVVGSPHKLVHQSIFNVMMAAPWLDAQEAQWVSEHVPHSVEVGRNKVRQNEWYLTSDDDWAQIKKGIADQKKYDEKKPNAHVDRRTDRDRRFIDVHNVWLYWPIVFEDAGGQTMEGVFSLLCPFDRNTNKLLAAPLNPYAHGRRNLVPYYQRPRVDDLGGYSTMEDVAPLQKVKTRLFHSQVQNAMLANTVFSTVRPGSVAWQWFKAGNNIRARSIVPASSEGDIKSQVLGRELRSLAGEIAALDTWAKDITVSDTVKGAQLLGRTSRAAISLVQEAGLTVPNMDLDFFRDCIGENLTMLLQQIGQWSAFGEEIPFRDPVTRAAVMYAVRFPIDGLSGFRVRITASSDEETAQFEFERDLGLAKLQGEKAMEAAQIFAPMVNPNAPPVVQQFNKKQLVGQQLLLARIYELAKMDPKKYTFTEREIDELLQQQQQWVQQQAAAAQAAAAAKAAQEANGGNVVRGAFGGGAVSGGAPESESPAGVGGAPGNSGPVPNAPPSGV